MANRLKMAAVDSIYTLLERGYSRRWIARTLGIDRETVRRYAELARADSNPAGAPPGSDTPGSSNPATAPPGSAPSPPPTPPVQPSACEPFRDVILAKLEQGLSRKRIWQDLVSDHNFPAEYHSVRRYVQKLDRASPLPFRRMECEPGEEAQVDFGQGAPVIQADGRRKRPHAFRIVLSHSRKAYSEVVWKQSTEEFIRCIENAFHYFGGVPKTLVIDNLKAAVTKADWFDPELNPKIRDFCKHYGTVILPTRPRMPRHKGKIEGGVKYVQDNGLKGLEFTGLEEQNRHLRQWEATVADTRIHGTTQKQVKKCFEEVERPALLPLPVNRFPSFIEAPRIVSRDGHVEVAKAYYSVPPEYLGCKVWVRWDSHTIDVFDHRMQKIVMHARKEPGAYSTHPLHIAPEKISGIERGGAWLMGQISLIGPQAVRWAEVMMAQRGIEGMRVLQGLRSLSGRYPHQNIERACEIAVGHGACRLRDIHTLLKRSAGVSKQEQFEFMDQHPIIRSLSEYGQLVHTAICKE